jgi:hypothetical protein
MMNHTYEFYIARAREAEVAAAAATLDNVRDRELRSAKTGTGLAEQAQRVAAERAKGERAKALQRELEAAAQQLS